MNRVQVHPCNRYGSPFHSYLFAASLFLSFFLTSAWFCLFMCTVCMFYFVPREITGVQKMIKEIKNLFEAKKIQEPSTTLTNLFT